MNQGVYDIFQFKGSFIAVLGYNINPQDQSITELVYVFKAKRPSDGKVYLEREDCLIAAISSTYKTTFVGLYVYQLGGDPPKNNALIVSSDNIRSYTASSLGFKLKQLKNSANKIVASAATSGYMLAVLSINGTNQRTIFEYSYKDTMAPLAYSFQITQNHNGTGQAKLAI